MKPDDEIHPSSALDVSESVPDPHGYPEALPKGVVRVQFLHRGEESDVRECRVRRDGDRVLVLASRCPLCDAAPLIVRGRDPRGAGLRQVAMADCLACGEVVGILVADLDGTVAGDRPQGNRAARRAAEKAARRAKVPRRR